jgi:hypothetical protein
LYAHGIEPKSLPGQKAPLGIETDIQLYLELPGQLRANVEAGFLIPLSAFRNQATGEEPEFAFSVQARLALTF